MCVNHCLQISLNVGIYLFAAIYLLQLQIVKIKLVSLVISLSLALRLHFMRTTARLLAN